MTDPLIAFAMIAALALVCQWLAWRINAPSIVLLLFCGIAVGPVMGWLDADQLLGDLLFPVVSLAVAVVLFEGSLTLRFADLRGSGATVWRLLTVGVLVTWAVIGCAVHYLVDLTWELSILFGAVMVVTGPTVIEPMLRSVRPNAEISRLLRWEGIVIDPVGAVLAILVFEVIILQSSSSLVGGTILGLAEILGVGISIGCGAGYLLGIALRNYWLPEYLQDVGTLLIVVVVFVAADSLVHESGLLAVTAMGIWLGNMRDVHTEDILDFKESLSLLLISALFILLASRLNLSALGAIWLPALGVFLAVQFIARPLKVLVATFGSSLSWPERGLLAWIAPRGIVAAAISALFALRLENIDYPGSELIVPLSFALIIGTVTWQGLTAPSLARWLGVAEPESKGVLFVGGNPVVLTLAEKLQDAGFRVLVADSSWDNISKARMAGLPTYFGNPVSEDAERRLNLSGLGRLFAMSRRPDLNALACLRFAHQFGRDQVFFLETKAESQRDEKHTAALAHRGAQLFGKNISHNKFASLLAQGGELRRTQLTDDFTFETLTQNDPSLVPLVAWDEKLNLVINSGNDSFTAGTGYTVLSLVVGANAKDRESKAAQ